MNIKANKLLKKKFTELQIFSCEICGTNDYLTFAHRKKRRFYRTVDELSDFNEVLLLDIKCHQLIEYDNEKKEEFFKRLRPKETV